MPSKPFHIAIVGGGLGGLATAIGLTRQGVSVRIYEKAAQFSEIGAGLAFACNAIRALGLIDPALLAGFRKHFDRNPEGFWMTVRMGMDMKPGNDGQEDYKAGDVVYNQRDEAESGNIHRARLLEEMVKLVPKGTTSFNKSLVRLEELPGEDGGSIRLHFADGTTATADAVIGCDGIKSTVRSQMAGKPVLPTFTGVVVYRQLVPRDVVLAELGEERALTSHVLFGYGTIIVHYPVNGGDAVNMASLHATGKTTWDGDDWVQPVTREMMLKHHEGYDPAIIRLMSRINKVEQWALFDLMHDEKYYRGRIAILGDAAHASTPYNAAGVGMAMEDAYVISQVVGRAKDKKELGRAFEIYDALRRSRTQKLVRNSRESGKIWQLSDEETRDIPSKLREQLDAKYHWIWNYDLQKEVEQALANEFMKPVIP
ncbi:hypothetical protein F5884DRAFT_737938 [Xylogone sp. PMI_703]|nr:hypothetical protein F5884DRAFT_737938 [Xylogone sp. PMI_703]